MKDIDMVFFEVHGYLFANVSKERAEIAGLTKGLQLEQNHLATLRSWDSEDDIQRSIQSFQRRLDFAQEELAHATDLLTRYTAALNELSGTELPIPPAV